MEPAPADKPRNPYSPPAALVADEPEVQREMPLAVRRAVVLMWVSMGLSLLDVALDWKYQTSTISPTFLIGYDAVMLAIVVLLIFKISAGRNWARITFLILEALALLAGVPALLETAARAPVVAGVNLVVIGIDLATLYLLFFPGRHFFKSAATVRGG